MKILQFSEKGPEVRYSRGGNPISLTHSPSSVAAPPPSNKISDVQFSCAAGIFFKS